MRFIGHSRPQQNGVKSTLHSTGLSSFHGGDECLPVLNGTEDVENGALLRD